MPIWLSHDRRFAHTAVTDGAARPSSARPSSAL